MPEYSKQQRPNGSRSISPAGTQIHELWFSDNWQHASLSALSAAPVPRRNSRLIGYATDYNNQDHVAFIGAGNSVHELWL
ncbi:MAG: hypothetical protein JO336_04025 [Acidobacteriia bacterium]|nr:hypothetical protein [Terriglobia bacterium]MBV8904009.1 hypothetical protein [Terriglobia bacterium]MBV9742513.1 hypothetical protein [Terriglobia bacterium]